MGSAFRAHPQLPPPRLRPIVRPWTRTTASALTLDATPAYFRFRPSLLMTLPGTLPLSVWPAGPRDLSLGFLHLTPFCLRLPTRSSQGLKGALWAPAGLASLPPTGFSSSLPPW